LNKPQIIVGVSKEDLRPPIGDDCPFPYAQLMRDCWDENPVKRPTFAEILQRLEQMQQMLQPQTTQPSSALADSDIIQISPMNLTQQFQDYGTTSKPGSTASPKPSWEIDAHKLEFIGELGEGTQSTVYKGKYQEKEVAIKVLKESADGKHSIDFKKELDVIRYDYS
jgi:hypothetical protein